MIHEILLALSGHSSPLLLQSKDEGSMTTLPLSLAERQLLANIENLSGAHRQLRQRLAQIAHKHRSVICQAAANSISQVQLRRFQDKILEIESSILTKDSSLVGAYDIVPLASIVGQFEEWRPRMQYLLEVTDFMVESCTGADLIDKLRADTQTGYKDLEAIAVEISKTVELAWLRQLSAWLLHGSIHPQDKNDFFICAERTEDGNETFRKRQELLPHFVASTTSTSILFTGRVLAHVRRNTSRKKTDLAVTNISDAVIAEHLHLLSTISLPIAEQQLNRIVRNIRHSISQNVLQHLLPPQLTWLAMSCLQQYFLLRDVELASCLIEEAERAKEARWQSMGRMLEKDPLRAMQGLSLKQSEINQILRRSLARLSNVHDRDDHEKVIDFAQKHILFSASDASQRRPSSSASTDEGRIALSPVSFADLLLPVSATMWMTIEEPLNMLISSSDIERYSTINSYLLAIHRARTRLCELWNLNSARRSYSAQGRGISQAHLVRRVWAACSADLRFLSELSAYLNADVLTPSCLHFQEWTSSIDPDGEESTRQGNAGWQRDPETIASAHRLLIDSITHAVLITDVPYTKDLRILLGSTDQLVVLFTRLLDLRRDEEQIGSKDAQASKEEDRVVSELEKACGRVQHGVQGVVERLQQIVQGRAGESGGSTLLDEKSCTYSPCRSGGLDRLVIKLQFGREINDRIDDDDDDDDNDDPV